MWRRASASSRCSASRCSTASSWWRNLNRARESGLLLAEAVLNGAAERLRSRATTPRGVATVGMLPAALATGVGRCDAAQPRHPWPVTPVPATAVDSCSSSRRSISPWNGWRGGRRPRGAGGRARRAGVDVKSGGGVSLRMAKGRRHRGVGALALTALLAGCAVIPTSCRRRPPTCRAIRRSRSGRAPVSAATPGGQAQRFVRDLDLPGQWWTLFHSKPLNALVERALVNNADVEGKAALRVARQNVRAQVGSLLFPQVDAGFAFASRCRSPDRRSTTPRWRRTFNLFTQLSVSYTPDVFGATRCAIETLRRRPIPSASSWKRPI